MSTPIDPDSFNAFEAAGPEFAALLRDAGLEDVDVRTIAFSYTVSSPDELWDGLLDRTVRTSALIQGQSQEDQRRIRAAFDQLVEDYRQGTALELPVSVKLAAGSSA